MRLLFARVGHPHCRNCGREIARQSKEQIVDSIFKLPETIMMKDSIVILGRSSRATTPESATKEILDALGPPPVRQAASLRPAVRGDDKDGVFAIASGMGYN